MSIEFGAVTPLQPQLEVVGRATGLLLTGTFQATAPVVSETSDHGMTFHLGGAASAFTTVEPPGSHEFAASWFTSCSPMTREPLAWLLALVAAAATAVLFDGRLIDEAGLLPPNQDATELLSRVLHSDSKVPEDIVEALRRRPPPSAPGAGHPGP